MKRTFLYALLILALALSACTAKTPTPVPQPTAVPVEPTAVPTEVPAEPAAAEAPTAESVSLAGTSWQWVSFTNPEGKTEVDSPENYTLTFVDDGTVEVKADCNMASGSYEVHENQLRINIGAMTRAACPPDSLSDEYLKYLGFSAIYFVEDGNLYIDLFADGGTMVFTPYEAGSEAAAASDLEGTEWHWVFFTSPETKTSVDTPENYTLSFQPEGVLAIKADCNNAGGSYEVSGNELKITIGPMTLAACPPDSLSDDYLKYLGATTSYVIRDGNLYLNLLANGGTMEFSPAGVTAESKIANALTAEPFEGTLYLGGGQEKWLDPTLISALGGSSEGRPVDVSTLNPDCSGYMPTRPDVVINWEAQEGIDTLRFFFLSLGDPSLVLVTPSGKTLCSDNFNPLVMDPYIEVSKPEAGKYLAYLGTMNPQVNYPGFLVVTSKDLNPATVDLARMFPRRVDPRGVPQVVVIDVLQVDGVAQTEPQNGKLNPTDLPYQQSMTGGGEIGAFNLQLEQEDKTCTGFIDAAPTFRFEWAGGSEPIAIYFEAQYDSSLFVRAPDGTFLCGDDFNGSRNLNPYITFEPQTGIYNVWVGGFAPKVPVEGLLTVTNDLKAEPEKLKK